MNEPSALVAAAKIAIASNLDRNVTLHELCAAMHCSPWQLCRAFRRATGQTLTNYRHALRMQIALERLQQRDTDLTELALELGYSSHSHFTHVFHRHLGITPSQVRAGERKKELPRLVPHEARQSA
ncbi:MAG: helix-turn-helix transcriptional regulator [Acidobacteriota bacterium]|nr:helix-turn-helix transcriptional regulator [Acidobacteriota bacterium]